MEAITEIGQLIAAADQRVRFLFTQLNSKEAQLESYRSLIVSLENEVARLNKALETEAGVLSHNMRLANRTSRNFMNERNEIIKSLRKEFSAIEIAAKTGLTRQRVHQILNEPEATEKEPKFMAEAAARAAVAFLIETFEKRPCDSEGVADCVRCNALVVARWLREMLDAQG